MNIHHLEYFVAVGRHSSVSRAARSLNISQPAVSEAVKQLEAELGVRLFHRVRQRVYLTEEGSYYLKRISKVMDELAEVNQEMAAIGKHRKTIRVGIPPMVGPLIFPQIFSGFREYRPDIDLELREDASMALVRRIAEEVIDLAIVSLPHKQLPDMSGLSVRVLKRGEFLVCLPLEHPLAAGSKVPIQDLAEENLLLNEAGYLQRDLILQAFAEAGVVPKVTLQTNQLATIIELVERGLGCSFLLDDTVRSYPQLAGVPLEPRISLDLSLVWKTSRTEYRDVKTFIDFIADKVILQERLPG